MLLPSTLLLLGWIKKLEFVYTLRTKVYLAIGKVFRGRGNIDGSRFLRAHGFWFYGR
jgi:hypothetical protein